MNDQTKDAEVEDAELETVAGGAGEPEAPADPTLKSERVGEG